MSIYLKVTNRCNLRCPHCYIKDYEGDMSIDVIKAVAEKLPEDRIIFHGGEPTLVGTEYIREAIQILGNRQFVLQSNLFITDDKTLKDWGIFAKEHFNSCIGTSIDSARASYFEVLLQNVRKLTEYGVSVIATVTVTNSISMEQICDMVDRFLSAGGAGFYLQAATPVKENRVLPEHFLSVWNRLKDSPANLSFKRVVDAFQSCYVNAVNGGNCAKRGVRTIDPDGTVYVCPDFAGQKVFPLGNVLSGFDDSPNNPNNRIFYERELSLVQSCSEDCWRYCQGGCASNTYFSGGLDGSDPYCEIYKRILDDVNNNAMCEVRNAC